MCGVAYASDTPATAFHAAKPVTFAAPALSPNEPLSMVADRMGYDEPHGIVMAQGNVEVVQADYILRADQITFYQKDNLMHADGNVSMLQPSGDVYFAEHVELTGDMKSGIIHKFSGRLADDSTIAAQTAVRVNPAVTTMKKAVYSPCNLCSGKDPFWQLKSHDVKVDNIREKVIYNDAVMEMSGVPVFYTPYFAHPTPDADAQSGFLIPEYSLSSTLGTMIKVPYYWRISPDKQLTLKPWYTSDEGALLQGTYQQLTDDGAYNIDFSGTNPQDFDVNGSPIGGSIFRGHIFAKGEENITPYSRYGVDIQRSSDDTYLRRYGLGNQYSLTSRAYIEGAEGRNFARGESILFQGLRVNDDPSKTPRILPSISGYYETNPLENGARIFGSSNIQSLSRPEDSQYKRASFTTGVKIPYVTEGGHVFEAGSEIRTDAYSVSDLSLSNGSTFDGEKTRAIPQAALSWRYPLMTQLTGGSTVTIEPTAVAVAQSNGGNPEEIPNLDNRVVELTDTNIFSTHRMPGYDSIDSGNRAAYGMRSQLLFARGQSIDAMLGQSYNTSETPFPNSRKLGEQLSDYIGRVGLNYQPFTLSYRFALDKNNLNASRNEIWTTYGSPALQLSVAYLSIQNSPYVSDSEEVLSSGKIQLLDEWSLYGNARRDVLNNAMVSATGGVIYENECFSVLTQMQRIYTRDRDIAPASEFSLRLGFKNFGEFGNR
jgi:LPS-assembly protein